MQLKKKQKTFQIVLTYENGMTRRVVAKGSTREIAEDRALKHNPNATGVKR
jgi:hypothetical protein